MLHFQPQVLVLENAILFNSSVLLKCSVLFSSLLKKISFVILTDFFFVFLKKISFVLKKHLMQITGKKKIIA